MADIETNVRLLADRVEDIELVIFESEQLSAYPSEEEVRLLSTYAARFGLTYTAHFPLDTSIAHPDAEKRERARAEIIRLYRRLRPLLPLYYILHVPIGEPEFKAGAWKTLPANELETWRNRAVEQLLLLRDAGFDTSAFCFENLDYPVEYLEPLIEAAGGGLCIDVGHLLHHGRDILSIPQRYREYLRVVHFHWHDGNRDHIAPPNPLPDDCRRLLQFLMTSDFQGVLTLEVFNENDLAQSLETIGQFLSLR
jgi:sugar phosphate isomerase/epimerase